MKILLAYLSVCTSETAACLVQAKVECTQLLFCTFGESQRQRQSFRRGKRCTQRQTQTVDCQHRPRCNTYSCSFVFLLKVLVAGEINNERVHIFIDAVFDCMIYLFQGLQIENNATQNIGLMNSQIKVANKKQWQPHILVHYRLLFATAQYYLLSPESSLFLQHLHFLWASTSFHHLSKQCIRRVRSLLL